LMANTSGTQNTAMGYQALTANQGGSYNTAMGFQALDTLNGGDRNVAVGREACRDQASGDNNTGIGTEALKVNSSGIENTAVGSYSSNSVTGSYNTSIGYRSLKGNTSGYSNVAVGSYCMDNNTHTGWGNTVVGQGAGRIMSSSNTCTFVGSAAGDNVTSGSGHTCVGYGTEPAYASSSSGELVFGNQITGNGTAYFSVGVGSNKGYYNYGSTNGFTGSSDERLKENIATSTLGLSFINDLRPVTFKWRKYKDVPSDMPQYVAEGEDGAETRHLLKETTQLGLIAQEVKTVIDNHSEVPDGFAGWSTDVEGTQGIDFVPFVPALIKAVQELKAENDSLKTRIEALEG